MNILYFLTYGYSLKTWNDSGQLTREITHFRKIHEQDKSIKFVIFSYSDESDISYINEDFITVIPIYKFKKISKRKFVNLLNSLFIKKFLKKIDLTDTNLIIQNQLLGCWVSIIVKKIINAPLIIRTGYDMYEFSINENKSIIKKLIFKFLTYLGLKFSNIYTVTSNCDKNFLVKKFSKKFHTKIKIRPNWVNIQETDLTISNKPRNSKNIVSVGRIEKQKNFELIIRALEKTEYALDIYGEGSLKQELQHLAESLGVELNFYGIISNNDLFRKLYNYTYYISSSKFEGHPKSILEAMSAGCVVIASNIKNHLEFLDNKNSILFENNIYSLRQVLLNLESDKKKYADLLLNSKKTIRENYSLQKLVDSELEDIYSLVN